MHVRRYDGDAGGPAGSAPDGRLWQPISTKGYKYKDKRHGVRRPEDHPQGRAAKDKAKALVKGKGDNLPDLPPANDPLLALDLPVKVQLINNSNGICFQGVYNSGDIKKNRPDLFKAKFKAP